MVCHCHFAWAHNTKQQIDRLKTEWMEWECISMLSVPVHSQCIHIHRQINTSSLFSPVSLSPASASVSDSFAWFDWLCADNKRDIGFDCMLQYKSFLVGMRSFGVGGGFANAVVSSICHLQSNNLKRNTRFDLRFRTFIESHSLISTFFHQTMGASSLHVWANGTRLHSTGRYGPVD